MTRKRILTFIAWLLATCLTILVVRSVSQPSSIVAQPNSTLLVSAAASLKEALEEIKPLYQQNKPNVNITYNFGASGALLQQLEQGAPADVFISAAKKQMDTLTQKGMIVSETQSTLATNRLVLLVPENKTDVTGFEQLRRDSIKKIAIGEPRSVPAGQYAEQVFQRLGIYEQVQPKLVLSNNVRQVLAAVESGNADAGVVYLTDAKVSPKAKVVVTADEQYHSPIVYPMAVLKSSRNAGAAKEFVQFLSGTQAKDVLKKHGFGLS